MKNRISVMRLAKMLVIMLVMMAVCVYLPACSPAGPDLPEGFETTEETPPAPAEAAETYNTSAQEGPDAATLPETIAVAKLKFTPELEAFMEELNREHEAVVKPEVDFDQYTLPRDKTGTGFSRIPYAVGRNTESGFDESQRLSFEEAETDIGILFRALKMDYGAYLYFGGDEVFHQAKEAVLQKCHEDSELTSGRLKEYMLESLGFVKDCHFAIEGQQAYTRFMVPVIYREVAFLKTAEGYVTVDGGRLVEAVKDHEDLDQLMKRSIADDGRLVYYPVVLQETKGDMFAKDAVITAEHLAVYYSGGLFQTLSGSPFHMYESEVEENVAFHENQGIPVVYCRNMYDWEASADGETFLGFAETLRDKPVMILDLRRNGGGFGAAPFQWLETYTGDKVTTNFVSISCQNIQDLLMPSIRGSGYTALLLNTVGYRSITKDYTEIYALAEQFVKNDTLLIVLTSKRTASSAEIFTDITRNVENTLVIGENTSGGMLGASSLIDLPNSHIRVSFGSYVSIFPYTQDYYFEEYTGLFPDLWVDAGRAEELAVAFIKRYVEESSAPNN